MDDFMRANRDLWDELTPIHVASRLYDVDGFRAGQSSLTPVELEEVGDVTGLRLLHLQCHFGLDTLSWARLGAEVTGVDFSSQAIAAARRLAADVAIPARFVEANIYDLPDLLPQQQFDIVYTSYGVLLWLPDIPRWARLVARLLAPGGRLHLVEFHPLSMIFDTSQDVKSLNVVSGYFHEPEPQRWEPEGGSYADRDAVVTNPSHEWMHPVSEVIQALLDAGLELESFREYPYTPWEQFAMLEKGADGYYRMPGPHALPLLYSVRAVKPAHG